MRFVQRTGLYCLISDSSPAAVRFVVHSFRAAPLAIVQKAENAAIPNVVIDVAAALAATLPLVTEMSSTPFKKHFRTVALVLTRAI